MKYFTAIIMLIFSSFSVYAGECSINKAQDVLNCALSNNPEIIQANSAKEIAGINKDVSGRWSGPNIDAGVAYDMEDKGDYGVTLDFAIMQPIEAPNRRNARINRTTAEKSMAELTVESQKDMVAFEALTIMNRLRQIDREKTVLNDAVKVFTNVIKSYRNRPILSPEDEISLNLFQTVLNNYRMENNKLTMESNLNLNNLKRLTNQNLTYNKKLFFYPPQKYPKIDNNADISNSIDMQKENTNIALANAYMQEQKAANFTEFSIGPYLTTSPNVQSVEVVGVKVSVPLPIYSNKKTTQAGQIAVDAAKYKYQAKKIELDNTFNQLKTQYEQGVNLLKNFNINQAQKQLTQTERLFKNGRVSSSLLIEAQRQMIDSVRLYHQYEMETLSSLWQLYSMQRKLISNINEVSYEKN